MENNRQVQGRAGTWPWMDGIQSLGCGDRHCLKPRTGLQEGIKGPAEPAASPTLTPQVWQTRTALARTWSLTDACLGPGFQLIQGREGPILSSILGTNEAPLVLPLSLPEGRQVQGMPIPQHLAWPLPAAALHPSTVAGLGGLRSWRLEFLRPSSEPFAGVVQAPHYAGK